MNPRAVILALVLALPAVAADARLLDCLREVEGVTEPARPGPARELGFYRLTPAVWIQHTAEPFARAATDHAFEALIAARHLDWLEQRLTARRLLKASTPARQRIYLLALAWNAGLAAASRGTAPRSARDYATRVVNLDLAGPP